MGFWDRLLGRPDPQVMALTQQVENVSTQLADVSAKLQEANALAQMYDPDMNLTASQGGSAYMRRLTQSARDFTPLQHSKALKLAFWLWETNPLAKRILGTTAAYLVGDGFEAVADYKEDTIKENVQDQIDRFWDDHVNLMDLKMPGYVLELGMWGELCLTLKPNPIDGLVRISSVDPANIKDLVFDGTDLVALILQTEVGPVGREERLKVIRMDEDPNSESYGLLVGATTDQSGKVTETWQKRDADGNVEGEAVPYLGSCMFFRVNNISHARRGRSDLLAVMDWLDAYDQELFNELERSALLMRFIWDVKLNGKTEAEIVAWLKNNGAPKPGAIRAHNEEVEWNAVTPDLKTKDSQQLAELILGHISTGTQYPKTWLNVTDDVNKATGQVLDEPTFRWMSARQRYIRYIVEQLIIYQLDQAELVGKLDARPKQKNSIMREPWQITVNATELRDRDLKSAGDNFARTVEGLVNATAEHFIDLATAQRVAVMLIEQLGLDVDIEEMKKKIEEEVQDAEEKMMQAVVPALPGQPPKPSDPTKPAFPPKPAVIAAVR